MGIPIPTAALDVGQRLCTLRQLLLYLSTEFNQSYPRFCRSQIVSKNDKNQSGFVQKLLCRLARTALD